MKSSVPPAVIAIAALVVIAIIGVVVWATGRGAGADADKKTVNGVPVEVQQELQRRMGGVTAPNQPGQMQSTAPPQAAR